MAVGGTEYGEGGKHLGHSVVALISSVGASSETQVEAAILGGLKVCN